MYIRYALKIQIGDNQMLRLVVLLKRRHRYILIGNYEQLLMNQRTRKYRGLIVRTLSDKLNVPLRNFRPVVGSGIVKKCIEDREIRSVMHVSRSLGELCRTPHSSLDYVLF